MIAIRERGGSIYMLETGLLVLRAKTGQGNKYRECCYRHYKKDMVKPDDNTCHLLYQKQTG